MAGLCFYVRQLGVLSEADLFAAETLLPPPHHNGNTHFVFANGQKF